MHGDSPSRSGDAVGHELDAALTERLRRASAAAHDLSDLLWEALHEELRVRPGAGPRTVRVAELSTRLADVASTVSALGGAVGRDTASASAGEPVANAPMSSAPAPAPPSSRPPPPLVRGQPFSSESPFAAEPALARGPSFASDPLSRVERPFEHAHSSSPAVVIVDERADPPVAEAPSGTRERPESSRAQSQIRPRPLPWDTPLTDELRATRSGERPSVPPR